MFRNSVLVLALVASSITGAMAQVESPRDSDATTLTKPFYQDEAMTKLKSKEERAAIEAKMEEKDKKAITDHCADVNTPRNDFCTDWNASHKM